jgi:hypothetical protein
VETRRNRRHHPVRWCAVPSDSQTQDTHIPREIFNAGGLLNDILGGYMKFRIQLLAFCLALMAAAFPGEMQVEAQSTTASIHGTVTDSTGAVLPEHQYFELAEDR